MLLISWSQAAGDGLLALIVLGSLGWYLAAFWGAVGQPRAKSPWLTRQVVSVTAWSGPGQGVAATAKGERLRRARDRALHDLETLGR